MGDTVASCESVLANPYALVARRLLWVQIVSVKMSARLRLEDLGATE